MPDDDEFNDPFAELTRQYFLAKQYDERLKSGISKHSFLHEEVKPKEKTTPKEKHRNCPSPITGTYFPILGDPVHERCNKCGHMRGPKETDLLCDKCGVKKVVQPRKDIKEAVDYLCDQCSKDNAKRCKS